MSLTSSVLNIYQQILSYHHDEIYFNSMSIFIHIEVGIAVAILTSRWMKMTGFNKIPKSSISFSLLLNVGLYVDQRIFITDIQQVIIGQSDNFWVLASDVL